MKFYILGVSSLIIRMEEFIESLTYILQTKGHEVIKVVCNKVKLYLRQNLGSTIRNSCIIILRGHMSILRKKEYFNENFNNKFIYLNTEQLLSNGQISRFKNTYRNVPFCGMIDYSKINIKLAKENGFSDECFYLPIYNTGNYGPNEKKYKYDVIFLGACTPKRITVINRLKERGYNIFVRDNCIWGDRKKKILNLTKIIIDIPRDDKYNIPNVHRIVYPMYNKNISIAQTFREDFDDEIVKKYCIQVDYDDIVDKVDNILQNYDSYLEDIYKDFDREEVNKYYDEHIEKFLNFINK